MGGRNQTVEACLCQYGTPAGPDIKCGEHGYLLGSFRVVSIGLGFPTPRKMDDILPTSKKNKLYTLVCSYSTLARYKKLTSSVLALIDPEVTLKPPSVLS
jgi:hypothetical protein